MRRSYAVRWSERAENDFKAIVRVIVKDSIPRARETLATIGSKVSGLGHFPKRGRVVPELEGQGLIQYRELIVGPWRIIYRVSEKAVYILSVIDSRRNVEDILLERFVNQEL